MVPLTLNYEGKEVTLQSGKSHGYNQVILLKNGIIGRRMSSSYPDWWRGFYYLQNDKGLHKFHIDEICGVYAG